MSRYDAWKITAPEPTRQQLQRESNLEHYDAIFTRAIPSEIADVLEWTNDPGMWIGEYLCHDGAGDPMVKHLREFFRPSRTVNSVAAIMARGWIRENSWDLAQFAVGKRGWDESFRYDSDTFNGSWKV